MLLVFELPALALDLIPHLGNARPVKARLCRSLRELLALHERWQRDGYAVEQPRLSFVCCARLGPALFPLHTVPDIEHLVHGGGGPNDRGILEDVRVAAHELLVEAFAHPVDIELAVVCGDLRMQKHLLEHVTQLLTQVGGVICLYGVNRLVGLLDHVPRDRAMRLCPVPGTAIRLAQAPDRAHEPIELGVRGRGTLTLARLCINLVDLPLSLAVLSCHCLPLILRCE